MNTPLLPSQADQDDEFLRDIDPQTLKLWNAQTRAQMAYQRRIARLLREQGVAASRARAALNPPPKK